MSHSSRRRGPRVKPDPEDNPSMPDSGTVNFGIRTAPSASSSYGGSTSYIPPDQAFYHHRSDAREYLFHLLFQTHTLTKSPKQLQVNASLSLNLF
jgi:hypothetical protein